LREREKNFNAAIDKMKQECVGCCSAARLIYEQSNHSPLFWHRQCSHHRRSIATKLHPHFL
jgi:hypothetical protein